MEIRRNGTFSSVWKYQCFHTNWTNSFALKCAVMQTNTNTHIKLLYSDKATAKGKIALPKIKNKMLR